MRLVTVMLMLAAGLYAQGQGQGQGQGDGRYFPVCTNATLRGEYGFLITGSRPSGPAGPTEQMIGVAVTRFDGSGNLTQFDNLHGSITGNVTDRPGWGTYMLREDCSGTMTLWNQGVPFALELRIVVVDNGREVRAVVMSPAPVMVTANGKKK